MFIIKIHYIAISFERYYVTFALCHRNPVSQSSVTSVHPTHSVELFGNIFATYNSLWNLAACVKILKKN